MNKITKPFSAFIFDMDGILLDSESIYKQVYMTIGKQLGFEISEEIYLQIVGTNKITTRDIIKTAMGSDFPYDEFDARWVKLVSERMAENVPLKTGAKEILALLELNNIPFALATSTPYKAAKKHLIGADIYNYFDIIISGDDVVNGKPHPEPFLKAATGLGINPSECVAIEDSYNGVRSAHRAGMQVIMIPDQLPENDEMRQLCHAILSSLNDMPKACSL